MSNSTSIQDASGSTFYADGTTVNVQTVEQQNVTGSGQENASLTVGGASYVGFKFGSGLAATTETWATATAWLTASGNATDTQQLFLDVWSDSAGLPGALLANAGTMPGNGIPTSGSPNPIEMASLTGAFSPTNSTNYWLVMHLDGGGTRAGTYGVAYDNSTGSGLVATSSNSGSTWGAVAGTGYFQLGQGTSHSLIGSSPTGHGVDASTITGTAVYGKSTGTKGYAGYFVTGPGGRGVFVDATDRAAAMGFTVQGTNGQQLTVDPTGLLTAPGFATNVRTITTNRTLDATDSLVFVNASSLTVTLPAPSVSIYGRRYWLKNLSGRTGTIVNAVSGNVEGGASDSTSLASSLAYAEYACNFTDWYRIG